MADEECAEDQADDEQAGVHVFLPRANEILRSGER
jgi:hypothetical protein